VEGRGARGEGCGVRVQGRGVRVEGFQLHGLVGGTVLYDDSILSWIYRGTMGFYAVLLEMYQIFNRNFNTSLTLPLDEQYGVLLHDLSVTWETK